MYNAFRPYVISIQVMGTQQRDDLLVNIPALRKLDAMLLVSMAVSFFRVSSNQIYRCNGAVCLFLL